jgi:hypothetical protein
VLQLRRAARLGRTGLADQKTLELIQIREMALVAGRGISRKRRSQRRLGAIAPDPEQVRLIGMPSHSYPIVAVAGSSAVLETRLRVFPRH